MTNKDYNTLLEQQKVDLLFSQSGVPLGVAAVAAILISSIFWQLADKIIIGSWLASFLGLCALRYYLVSRYLQSDSGEKDYRSHFHSFNVGSLVSGILWGGFCIYLLSISSTIFTSVIILTLCGLIAGTVSTYAIAIPVYFSFSIPAVLPASVFLMLTDDPLMNFYGIGLIIFYLFIAIIVVKQNKMIIKSIYYQFENLNLMEKLKLEKSQIAELNNNLNMDMAKWKEVETQLTKEKQKALEMAEKLLAISILDGLTGMPNRRNFDQILAKEWNRSIRASTPLSLIMCDIDHFKSYNDHYGHQKGDNCLIRIATTLQDHARRDSDLATRYGGEEFAIILSSTYLENATEVAEKIQRAVINLSIPHEYSNTDNIVTVSIGVATIIPSRNQDSRSLISLSDKALYQAKQAGRNRVIQSGQED